MMLIQTKCVVGLNADGCQKSLALCILPHKSALTNLIASSMTARESFACYRDGDGNVIALDKTGF